MKRSEILELIDEAIDWWEQTDTEVSRAETILKSLEKAGMFPPIIPGDRDSDFARDLYEEFINYGDEFILCVWEPENN